jgi:glycerol uptake facilitator-like aquaporin
VLASSALTNRATLPDRTDQVLGAVAGAGTVFAHAPEFTARASSRPAAIGRDLSKNAMVKRLPSEDSLLRQHLITCG